MAKSKLIKDIKTKKQLIKKKKISKERKANFYLVLSLFYQKAKLKNHQTKLSKGPLKIYKD